MNRYGRTISLRVLLKWLGSLLLLLAYLVPSGLLSLLPLSSRARRALRVRVSSFFAGLALALFGVRVHTKYREHPNVAHPGRLVIANHVSYVDVLVLATLMPSVFITSIELKNTPLLGMLTRFAGSLFVERRRPAGLKQEIEDIADVLAQGFTVVLFPEGTTSNGDRVHPFKKSLFDSAVSAGADIVPLCLRYTRIDRQALSPSSRDRLFYYGEVSFMEHFPRFLSLRSVEVEVIPLKIIKARDHASRKEIAALAHDVVSNAYHA
jgi:1-acyl-sn-glycerol-3-phosphate acyltransferase